MARHNFPALRPAPAPILIPSWALALTARRRGWIQAIWSAASRRIRR